MAGRKSLKDELEVLRRYEQLAPKVFAYVTKMLEEGSELDKRWAADWLKAAYVKMIPQKVQGDAKWSKEINTIKGESVADNARTLANLLMEAGVKSKSRAAGGKKKMQSKAKAKKRI